MTERYHRQIILNEIGTEGQLLLSQSTVAIVGIGALGTVAAELLARAGIGTLILIDRDIIEETNLQRQMLFNEEDIDKSKALAAREDLHEINKSINIEAHAIHLSARNLNLLKKANLIIDGTDNLKTRLLLNEFCKKNKLPYIYGAAIKTTGYVMPILPEGPCLGCFLHEASLETCDTVGIVNTITTLIASLQTTIALKILLRQPVQSLLYHINIWDLSWKALHVNKNQNCKTCLGEFSLLDSADPIQMIKFCSSGRYQITGQKKDFAEMKQRWQQIDHVKENKETLSFKNITLFRDGHALVKAASEQDALASYAKWVGM